MSAWYLPWFHVVAYLPWYLVAGHLPWYLPWFHVAGHIPCYHVAGHSRGGVDPAGAPDMAVMSIGMVQ